MTRDRRDRDQPFARFVDVEADQRQHHQHAEDADHQDLAAEPGRAQVGQHAPGPQRVAEMEEGGGHAHGQQRQHRNPLKAQRVAGRSAGRGPLLHGADQHQTDGHLGENRKENQRNFFESH